MSRSNIPSQTLNPIGVKVAAVVLGLAALFQLMAAAFALMFAFLLPQMHPQLQSGMPASMPTAVRAMQIGMAAIMLAISIGFGAVVIGLFQMRSWARYCILILGGLEAFFGAAFCVLVPMIFHRVQMPEGTPPGALTFIILFPLLLYGSIAAIGIWWLVYFNRRHVREAFGNARLRRMNGAGYGSGYGPGAPGYFPAPDQLGAPGIVTSSQIASQPAAYYPVMDAAPPAWQPNVSPTYQSPHQADDANAFARIGLLVMGCLYLVGAAFFPVALLFHLPLFVLGFLLYGKAAMVGYLLFTAFQVYMAVGLLRRWIPAWWCAIAFQGFGLLSALLLLLPSYRARQMAATDQVTRSMYSWLPPNPLSSAIQTPMLIFGALVGLCAAAFFITVLLRARPLFRLQRQTK